MPMQKVEMFVGLYEGEARTWYETVVEVPASTPSDRIREVALETLARRLETSDEAVAFYGVMPLWATVEPDGTVGTAAGR